MHSYCPAGTRDASRPLVVPRPALGPLPHCLRARAPRAGAAGRRSSPRSAPAASTRDRFDSTITRPPSAMPPAVRAPAQSAQPECQLSFRPPIPPPLGTEDPHSKGNAALEGRAPHLHHPGLPDARHPLEPGRRAHLSRARPPVGHATRSLPSPLRSIRGRRPTRRRTGAVRSARRDRARRPDARSLPLSGASTRTPPGRHGAGPRAPHPPPPWPLPPSR